MRKTLLLLCLLAGFTTLKAQQYQSFNMDLVGHWDDNSLPSLGLQTYSEVWGYVDSASGREYVIFGSIDSIYFFEILANGTPVIRDVEAGRSKTVINRDFQTYRHYCYASADQGDASLQIFDLQYLPDSVSKVYDSDSLSLRCHTICIEKDRLYMNSNTTKQGGLQPMQVFSLTDPVNPQLLGTLQAPIINGTPMFTHVHDMLAVNDTAWLSNGNNGLFIYDYRNPASPVLLNAYTDYPEKGYNHNGWLSPDHKYFVFTDENTGLGVKLIQVDKLNDITLKKVFRSNVGAVAHNPFIKDQFIYTSTYHDGVYVYDMSNPNDVRMVAFFDTYWQNDTLPLSTRYNSYEGCWGVYPYLPSGYIVGSDMTNGLFVLKPQNPLGKDKAASAPQSQVNIYPNPGRDLLFMDVFMQQSGAGNFRIFSLDGRELFRNSQDLQQGRNQLQIDISVLPAGSYCWELESAGTRHSGKLMIQ